MMIWAGSGADDSVLIVVGMAVTPGTPSGEWFERRHDLADRSSLRLFAVRGLAGQERGQTEAAQAERQGHSPVDQSAPQEGPR